MCRVAVVVLGCLLLTDGVSAAEKPSQRRPGLQTAARFWSHDVGQSVKLSKRLDRPLLIHFFASWCGPCKQMEATVLDTSALKRRLAGRVVAVKVDFDRDRATAARYGVRLLPTDVLVSPDGKVLARTTGGQGLRSYLATFDGAASRYRGGRKPRLGLEGYSPVSLLLRKRWHRGHQRFAARVGDVEYRMASVEELKQFRSQPHRFAPGFAGCDPVLLAETRKRVAGSIHCAAFFGGALYLFKDDQTRSRFRKDPNRYATRSRVPARAASQSTGR